MRDENHTRTGFQNCKTEWQRFYLTVSELVYNGMYAVNVKMSKKYIVSIRTAQLLNILVLILDKVHYSKTCVRKPPLKLTLVVAVERWLSYKGTCHVILLAKLHDTMTCTFIRQTFST